MHTPSVLYPEPWYAYIAYIKWRCSSFKVVADHLLLTLKKEMMMHMWISRALIIILLTSITCCDSSNYLTSSIYSLPCTVIPSHRKKMAGAEFNHFQVIRQNGSTHIENTAHKKKGKIKVEGWSWFSQKQLLPFCWYHFHLLPKAASNLQ
jgi:hypothetical protein